MSNYNNGYNKGGYNKGGYNKGGNGGYNNNGGGNRKQQFGGSPYRKNAMSGGYTRFADNGEGATANVQPEFKGNHVHWTCYTNRGTYQEPIKIRMTVLQWQQFAALCNRIIVNNTDFKDGEMKFTLSRPAEKGSDKLLTTGEMVFGFANGLYYIGLRKYKAPEINFPFDPPRFENFQINHPTGESLTPQDMSAQYARTYLTQISNLVNLLCVTEYLTPEQIQELNNKGGNRNGGGNGGGGGYNNNRNNNNGGGGHDDDPDDMPF